MYLSHGDANKETLKNSFLHYATWKSILIIKKINFCNYKERERLKGKIIDIDLLGDKIILPNFFFLSFPIT